MSQWDVMLYIATAWCGIKFLVLCAGEERINKILDKVFGECLHDKSTKGIIIMSIGGIILLAFNIAAYASAPILIIFIMMQIVKAATYMYNISSVFF